MFKLLRSKRGQIRGIDFSLAMVIFLLVMAQILVLTNTFIQSSRSFQSTNSLQQRSNSLARSIISTPGGTSSVSDWSDITSDNLGNWTFGLSDDNGKVDPFKLGRLADNTITDYRLNYSDIQEAIDLDSNFRIKITNSLISNITSIVDTGSNLDIVGSVKESGFSVDNAIVNLFTIDDTGNINQNSTQTNSEGIFSSSVSIAASEFYVVVALVKISDAIQDVTYRIVDSGTLPSEGKISLNKIIPSDLSSGYQVNVTVDQEGSSTQATFISLYNSQSSQNSSGPFPNSTIINSKYTMPVDVPQFGIGAFVVIQNGGTGTYVSVTSFPLLTEGEISSEIAPTEEPNVQSTVSSTSIVVRGVLLDLEITIWDD